MQKYVLIYLWIFIGIYGGIDAGDADEHVHIKLHMGKTGARKAIHHHHHTRHKKNPPPYGHAHISSLPHPEVGSGPGLSHTHIYHETPHNYLTGQHSSPTHYLHGHRGNTKQPSAVTHLHEVDGGVVGGGGHQQLMDASEYYTTDDGSATTASATTGLGGNIISGNGDFVLNDYLTSNFAAFPEPTTFEAEIMSSPQTNAELAYRTQKTREAPHHHYGHHGSHHQHYDAVAADVIAADQELEEDNEILGTLGGTTSILGDAIGGEWTPHHPKPPRGLSSSVKAMKNEHLLKHIMQQQEQQHPSFPYQPEIMNTVATAALLRTSSKDKYRNDKLHELATTEAERDAELEAMNAYDDMDLVTAYTDDGAQRGVGGYGGGVKPLTVDDIWSQLQRTYLSKYTPQAQAVRGEDEVLPAPSPSPSQNLHHSTKKHKRNSPKLKTRKRHQHHNRSATPPSTSFSAAKTLKYENNYYNQEHPTEHTSLYDSQHQQHYLQTTPVKSYTSSSPSFTPYSSYGSLSTDADLFETRATTATRPQHSFNAAISYETVAPNEAGADDNFEEDDTAASYKAEAYDDDSLNSYSSDEDASPEESMYSTTHKKVGNTRGHRNSHHSNSAYGAANLNYQDLYASHSTPISATIATGVHNVPVSTYHPNSYGVAPPLTPSTGLLQQQADSGPTLSHESTSYQWREQQHYPSASYKAYHHHQQQQQLNRKRPQSLHLQQYHPQITNALRLPKATVASTVSSSSSSPTPSSSSSHNQSPLASTSSSSGFSENDFATAVKQSTIQLQHQQQQYKKRKNRLKSKRNRIVVT